MLCNIVLLDLAIHIIKLYTFFLINILQWVTLVSQTRGADGCYVLPVASGNRKFYDSDVKKQVTLSIKLTRQWNVPI